MDEKKGMRSLRDILVTDKDGNLVSLLEALAGKVDKSQLESNEGVVVFWWSFCIIFIKNFSK